MFRRGNYGPVRHIFLIAFTIFALTSPPITRASTVDNGYVTDVHLRPVENDNKILKITGFAICGANLSPGTACSMVTLRGSGYDGEPVSPNAYVGFDYGRFTFEDVSVPNDLSDATFTVTASASQASAGIPHDESCNETFTLKGALVVGDTYGIDFGAGPWGWNHVCK